MLTKTSEMAIQALVYLARHENAGAIPPVRLAQRFGASPTYTAKVTNLLVKAGLLHSHRGPRGGVSLAKPAGEITLLEVVEACQGRILGDYCQEGARLSAVCAFHRAMVELQEAITGVLSRWTVGDIVARAGPAASLRGRVRCKMVCVEETE